MPSRMEQVSPRRVLVNLKDLLRGCPQARRMLVLAVLLAVTRLAFPAVASIALTSQLPERTGEAGPRQLGIEMLLQDTPEVPDETQEPTPGETPNPSDETPEPAPSETAEPPSETIEPDPSETPSPPAGGIEPTPERTSEPGIETPGIEPTPGETIEPEETITPVATEPAPARATATPVWPLGTIRFDDEETDPPARPIRVTTEEWLRLALAGGIVALVTVFGGRTLYRLLRSAIARRGLEVDETLLTELRPLFSWWLAAIGCHIAVSWVNFQNGRARALFTDLAFFGYLAAATLTALRLVDRAINLYTERIASEGEEAAAESLHPVIRRWARVLILFFAALIGLGRLDIGFSAPTILVLLIGFTISLAARDTLTDVIAGFSILIDRPFRIGDRIEVQGFDTWADVVDIGLRTSVLLTRHNVEIVVPNSILAENQVINYSYPDPSYRMETHVGVAFGTDVEHARRVMVDAVRQSGCAMPDEPVDALYVEIGDSAMMFRIRWWIDYHQDWEKTYDCIHTALHNALDDASIESPFPTQTLNLHVEPEMAERVSRALRGANGDESGGTDDQSLLRRVRVQPGTDA